MNYALTTTGQNPKVIHNLPGVLAANPPTSMPVTYAPIPFEIPHTGSVLCGPWGEEVPLSCGGSYTIDKSTKKGDFCLNAKNNPGEADNNCTQYKTRFEVGI